MTFIRSVTALTDFSEQARYAAERAAIVAYEHHADLRLLHVISGPSLREVSNALRGRVDVQPIVMDNAVRLLNEEAANIQQKTGMAAHTLLKTGEILSEIRSASESTDLLVLGAQGADALRHFVLGTTAERLLRTCKRPMLVSRRRPNGTYDRVLVPVDFSADSSAALNMARRIARTAQITIVHAFSVPFEARLRIAGATDEAILRYCEEKREDATKRIRDLTGDFKGEAHRISHVVEHGDPSRVILAKEEEFAADLIIIGKHGQSRLHELLLGSVTRHVLAGARCDVLVVHEGNEGS